MGDFNVKIGSDNEGYEGVMHERQGMGEIRPNENGDRLRSLSYCGES